MIRSGGTLRVGSAMYQQVSNAGVEYKHWNLRGDLAATSSPTGAYSPAPITDAFGDLDERRASDLRLERRMGDGVSGSGIIGFSHAPVSQWIERRPPEPGAQVRFLPGARYFSCITSSRLPAVIEAW